MCAAAAERAQKRLMEWHSWLEGWRRSPLGRKRRGLGSNRKQKADPGGKRMRTIEQTLQPLISCWKTVGSLPPGCLSGRYVICNIEPNETRPKGHAGGGDGGELPAGILLERQGVGNNSKKLASKILTDKASTLGTRLMGQTKLPPPRSRSQQVAVVSLYPWAQRGPAPARRCWWRWCRPTLRRRWDSNLDSNPNRRHLITPVLLNPLDET